jgi:hypothetical protein
MALDLEETGTEEYIHVFSAEIRNMIFGTTVINLVFHSSLLDRAVASALSSLMQPEKGTWSDAFKYMYLGGDGELCWAPIDLEQSVSNSIETGQSSSGDTGPAIGPTAGPRRPGRPRKTQEAPKVKSQVRYCIRNNNEGYCHQVLADTRRPRKTDKAVTPDVLQLEEMRRIGVEECQIDPSELTDERLMQEKKN